MKKQLFYIHAEICKVFSNPIRLEILEILSEKEMSVTELMKLTELSQANISQHLSIMKNKGIVESWRDGKNIYYKIANPKIIKAFSIIKEIILEKIKKESLIINKLGDKK